MFTHFRPAAKKQAPKPSQNKNSVYIKYGYFMGNPAKLAAQRQAEAGLPVPEAEETVMPDTEHKDDDITVVPSDKVIARPKGIANSYESINKKPFILYRKSKSAKAATTVAVVAKATVNTSLPTYCKLCTLQGFVNAVSICCRGGPVIT